jgi:hypothetical protein
LKHASSNPDSVLRGGGGTSTSPSPATRRMPALLRLTSPRSRDLCQHPREAPLYFPSTYSRTYRGKSLPNRASAGATTRATRLPSCVSLFQSRDVLPWPGLVLTLPRSRDDDPLWMRHMSANLGRAPTALTVPSLLCPSSTPRSTRHQCMRSRQPPLARQQTSPRQSLASNSDTSRSPTYIAPATTAAASSGHIISALAYWVFRSAPAVAPPSLSIGGGVVVWTTCFRRISLHLPSAAAPCPASSGDGDGTPASPASYVRGCQRTG